MVNINSTLLPFISENNGIILSVTQYRHGHHIRLQKYMQPLWLFGQEDAMFSFYEKWNNCPHPLPDCQHRVNETWETVREYTRGLDPPALWVGHKVANTFIYSFIHGAWPWIYLECQINIKSLYFIESEASQVITFEWRDQGIHM